MNHESTSDNETTAPATNIFHIGVDLLGEVQKALGTNRVRTLRLKLGKRVIKEIHVKPLTAVATAILVLLAVFVTTMSIEIVHEPVPEPEPEP